MSSVRLSAVLLLLGLPLGSGWLAGFPEAFSELPPRTITLDTPPYSAGVYMFFTAALVLAVVFAAVPGLFGLGRGGRSDFSAFDWALTARPGYRFPRRGWIGVALIAVSWPAAWIHPGWLGWAADHTFFPLWLGYVLTVDGLTYRRAGASPATRWPLAWLAWFPASAAAWWYFELLNRFIQNWVYLGVADFSPLRYVVGSTLAFSTVIPAVLTTAALLSTVDGFRTRFARAAPLRTVPMRRRVWWAAVGAGALGLAAVPWFPVTLFPVVWIAPLLIVAGLLELAGRASGLGHLLRGDWGPVVVLAAGALACGFFWELWNIYAMPKWTYEIPWVNRFELFEMPIVGYLGYLPFGPACWGFWLLLSANGDSRPRPGEGK